MPKSFVLATVFIIFTLLSNTRQGVFQNFLFSFPMPSIQYGTRAGDTINFVVSVRGATDYKHIAYIKYIASGTHPSRQDSNYHQPDNISLMATSTGTAISIVYIKTAPGLAKVQMAYFQSNVKSLEKFYLAGQFDKGFFFLELKSIKSCATKVTTGGNYDDIYGFSIFYRKEDAYDLSLPEIPFGSIVNTLDHRKYYLRLRYNTSITLSNQYIISILLQTVPDSPQCENVCPSVGNFQSLAAGTANYCSCVGFSIYDPTLKMCITCLAGSTRIECTSMNAVFCGNGIKEGSQECDNGNEMGCYFCKVDIGFYCTEDSNRYSNCSSRCGDRISAMDEECDNGNQAGCRGCQIQAGYNCTLSQSNESICTSSSSNCNGADCSNICGNGIRETNEQCDNRKGSGCQKCLIQSGFICSEDENKFSTCLNQSENNSRKIIIGACVGVGSAIIVGLSIFLIVKYLKAKALTVQLAESTKVNINHGPENEFRRQPETISVIQL